VKSGCALETTGLAAFADLLGDRLRSKLAWLRPSGSLDPQIAALIARLESYGSPKVMREAPAATAIYCLPSIK
jgi:hypothetical protein